MKRIREAARSVALVCIVGGVALAVMAWIALTVPDESWEEDEEG